MTPAIPRCGRVRATAMEMYCSTPASVLAKGDRLQACEAVDRTGRTESCSYTTSTSGQNCFGRFRRKPPTVPLGLSGLTGRSGHLTVHGYDDRYNDSSRFERRTRPSSVTRRVVARTSRTYDERRESPMSRIAELDVPLAVLEENREQLERLAVSTLPISTDAQRALDLLDEEVER